MFKTNTVNHYFKKYCTHRTNSRNLKYSDTVHYWGKYCHWENQKYFGEN